jgi:hypothetical protein
MQDLVSTDDGLKDDRNRAVLPQVRRHARRSFLFRNRLGGGRRGFNRQGIAQGEQSLLALLGPSGTALGLLVVLL